MEARRQNADTVKVLKEKNFHQESFIWENLNSKGGVGESMNSEAGERHDAPLCSVRRAEGRVLQKAGWLDSQQTHQLTATPLEDLVPSSGLCGYHTCAVLHTKQHNGEELMKGHYRLGRRDGNSRPYAVTALACRSMVWDTNTSK